MAQQQSKSPNAKQFCHYWSESVAFSKRGIIWKKYKKPKEIEKTYTKWKNLISAYENSSGQNNQTCKD